MLRETLVELDTLIQVVVAGILLQGKTPGGECLGRVTLGKIGITQML